MHNDPLPQSQIEAGTIETGTRALAPVGYAGPAGGAGVRHDAGFLTQLIACSRGLPAYRARRRADPREASGRYAEREAQAPARACSAGRHDRSF